ncbi:hypothetical protein KCP70_19475 [Salmonella enterica subsp. enterica]|nr:hypothetical protein KCP70_19475 [Salmonella enterica subsp. enterica]
MLSVTWDGMIIGFKRRSGDISPGIAADSGGILHGVPPEALALTRNALPVQPVGLFIVITQLFTRGGENRWRQKHSRFCYRQKLMT